MVSLCQLFLNLRGFFHGTIQTTVHATILLPPLPVPTHFVIYITIHCLLSKLMHVFRHRCTVRVLNLENGSYLDITPDHACMRVLTKFQ
jgi:hypothetical protein